MSTTNPEQRQQGRRTQADALREQVNEQVTQLRSGHDWQAWLAFAARFPQYSFRNVMAIYTQRPDATLVASYDAWQRMGRQVQRRERVGPGIRIFASVVRPEADQEKKTATTRADGYRTTHVFDISQTRGDPPPDPPGANPLPRRSTAALSNALAAQIRDAGFTIERGPTDTLGGYTDYPSNIVSIPNEVDDTHAAQTLAHELAHVLMHDTTHLGGPTTAECGGISAIEAESVAYLIAARAGIDASISSFGDIAERAGGDQQPIERVIAATGQRIVHTAHQITARLERGHPESPNRSGREPTRAAETRATGNLGVRAQAGQQAAASVRRRADAALATASPPQSARTGEQARLVAACEAAASFHRDQLLNHPGGEPARRYLTNRGLGHVLDLDSPWQVGYAPAAWRDLRNHLRGRGFSDQDIAAAGLSTPARHGPIDRFRGRIVAPIRDTDHAAIAFIGRTFPTGPPIDGPKYLNSPATAIYDKTRALYGLAEQHHELAAGARPVIVEGYFDVLAVAAPGNYTSRVAAVAPCGTSLSAHHVQALTTAAPSAGAVAAFDNDRAGHAAALRTYDLFTPQHGPLDAAQLPAGMDPADMADHPDALRTLLTDPAHLQPLADLVIDDRVARWEQQLPPSLETSIEALRSAAPIIAELPPDQIAPRVPSLAERLDLTHETVTAEIADALTDADTRVSQLPTRPLQEESRGAYSQGAEPARLAGTSFPRPNIPTLQDAVQAKPVVEEEDRTREGRRGHTELTRP